MNYTGEFQLNMMFDLLVESNDGRLNVGVICSTPPSLYSGVYYIAFLYAFILNSNEVNKKYSLAAK